MWGDPVICIFDFFAGTGYDKNGVEGSPIRILQKIREQTGFISEKRVKIKVFFNELDKEKLVCGGFLQNKKLFVFFDYLCGSITKNKQKPPKKTHRKS
jgi:hypothetical protein